MAMFIPHHLGKHHRSKREKGLTKRVIGAKVGQPADMDFGTHVYPPGKRKTFEYTHIMPAGSLSICSELLTFEKFLKYENAPLHPIFSSNAIERGYI
jgi:hypothetical protein